LLIIPAVDIMGGKVVRLVRGDPEQAKSYDYLGDPVTVAKRWESEGAQLIHVVDLDAALGFGENTRIIENITHSVNIPVQVGGGIRSVERAHRLVDAGVTRIVLGSLAFKSIESLKLLLENLGSERIVIALDYLNNRVMIGGWRESAHLTLREAAVFFSSLGVKYFLVTSIKHDGVMMGPDVEGLSRILDLGVNIMASGGIRSLNDIAVLRDLGVYGVIIGRALYEGYFTLKEALKISLGRE